jgi:hypothetical protein
MISIVFTCVVLSKIAVGFYCAMKLTSDNPWWVRYIVLAPCLTGFYVLATMLQGDYVAYWGDVFRTLAVIPIYMLVAALVSGDNWLAIRTQPKPTKE